MGKVSDTRKITEGVGRSSSPQRERAHEAAGCSRRARSFSAAAALRRRSYSLIATVLEFPPRLRGSSMFYVKAKLALMDFLTARFGEWLGLAIYAAITATSLAALTWALS
jgi:hypothetical protein